MLVRPRFRWLSRGLSVLAQFVFAIVDADRGGNHLDESGWVRLLVDQNRLDRFFEAGFVLRQEGTVGPTCGYEESSNALEFCGIGGG
jgi:hypothetical protein